MSASEKEKFFNRASIAGADQCWRWLGSKGGGGKMYGTIFMRSGGAQKQLYAHRVAKEIAIGRPLVSDETLHHTCQNTLCVNPRHLLIVSRAEHRSKYDRRTHCKNGHPYEVLENGHQICRICHYAAQKRRRHASK